MVWEKRKSFKMRNWLDANGKFDSALGLESATRVIREEGCESLGSNLRR